MTCWLHLDVDTLIELWFLLRQYAFAQRSALLDWLQSPDCLSIHQEHHNEISTFKGFKGTLKLSIMNPLTPQANKVRWLIGCFGIQWNPMNMLWLLCQFWILSDLSMINDCVNFESNEYVLFVSWRTIHLLSHWWQFLLRCLRMSPCLWCWLPAQGGRARDATVSQC